MLGEPDEAKSSHRLTGASWWYRALFVAAPWVVAVGVGAGAFLGNSSWIFVPVTLLFAPVTLWVFGRMPDEVRTDSDGLTFIAPRRTVRVPWDELLEIGNWNKHPMWLVWRWGQDSIVTHSQLSDRAELIRIAERNAQNLRSTP